MLSQGKIRVTVHIQQRRDGGLRVWSDDVPSLVLSHRDAKRVLDDIAPALEFILSEKMGCTVKAERLNSLPLAAKTAPIGRHAPKFQRFFNMFDKVQFAASPCTP